MFASIDYQPPAAIRRFQEQKLAETLAYVSVYSPFYRQMFRDHKIDVEKIRQLGDLQHIPLTDKNDLQNKNEEFLCVPRH